MPVQAYWVLLNHCLQAVPARRMLSCLEAGTLGVFVSADQASDTDIHDAILPPDRTGTLVAIMS